MSASSLVGSTRIVSTFFASAETGLFLSCSVSFLEGVSTTDAFLLSIILSISFLISGFGEELRFVE
jgi:hypothetical protein